MGEEKEVGGLGLDTRVVLSLIHISEPTRQAEISYAVSGLKKTTSVRNTKRAKAELNDLQECVMRLSGKR